MSGKENNYGEDDNNNNSDNSDNEPQIMKFECSPERSIQRKGY